MIPRRKLLGSRFYNVIERERYVDLPSVIVAYLSAVECFERT